MEKVSRNLESFPKKLENFQIIPKLLEKIPRNLESFPKKLENFQIIWKQFGINSKKVGKIPKNLEKVPRNLESFPKKNGKFPNNLETIWNQFQENWKNSKTFGINFIVDLLQSLT